MIGFDEAIKLLKENYLSLEKAELDLEDAFLSFLAADIVAPINLPPFANSKVDGFSLNSTDFKNQPLTILKEPSFAKAQSSLRVCPPNMAMPIMTGAPLPKNADVVLMKEDALLINGGLSFAKAIKPGENIRPKGEDIAKGQIAAFSGQRLKPATLGFLAGLGLKKVLVHKLPKLSIICTGDELVKAPANLNHGEVYFLVGPMLKALAMDLGFQDIKLSLVKDDPKAIFKAMEKSANSSLIFLTGGMSVGDKDFVKQVLQDLKVEEIFCQGFWRPGKPLYFGQWGKRRVFGLPGNPVACFVGFKIFVQAMLEKSLATTLLNFKTGFLTQEYSKKPEWTIFARAHVDEKNQVFLKKAQDSHHLKALSESNALCWFKSNTHIVKAQDAVQYLPL